MYVIRLTLPASAGTDNELHIRELEAYDAAGAKLDLRMADPPTDPAGPMQPHEPSATIDGDYTTAYLSSVAAPGAATDRWLEWVVPNGYRPATVKVWNRDDGYQRRLIDAVLEVKVREAGGVDSPPIQTAVVHVEQDEYTFDVSGLCPRGDRCCFFGGGSGRWIPPPPTSAAATPVSERRPLGSANAETTPAGAPAAAAHRTQRPDATCEGENG